MKNLLRFAAASSAQSPSMSMVKFGSRILFSLVTSFLLAAGSPRAWGVGASTPFTTLEAEAGTIGGGATVRSLVLTSSPPTVSSPELEASGRAFVQLAGTGQSVSWTNPVANATALNVRFSIPDGANGGGTTATLDLYVNGTFRQAITLNSGQAWLYETTLASNGLSNTPGAGLSPHLFFDEAHFFITGAAVASGSTIMLKQDSTNTAAFYYIDCLDIEAPPAALTQPANSLSITSYGAVGNGTTDSTTAIQNCINAAQTQGKSVWIPSGTFLVTGKITESGVTIAGAGMWYSTIYKNPPAGVRSEISAAGGTIQDVYINTSYVTRGLGNVSDYGINANGTGMVIQRVWLQHTDAAVWMDGTNNSVHDCRIANTFADGINLNNGNDSVGNNLSATNNFIRGTGDDGLAIYANNPNGTGTNINTASATNNTIVAPWWADGLRIAGGQNITVSNNYITDAITNKGIIVGIFGSTGFPLVSSTVNNNTVLRSGGGAFPYAFWVGGTSTQPVSSNVHDNYIGDSLYNGLAIGNGATLTFGPNNIIDTVGINAAAIDITANSTGTGSFSSNIIDNLQTGQTEFVNNSPSTFTATQTSEAIQFEAESATIPNYSGPDYRVLTDPGFSDDEGVILDSTAVGNYITFTVPNVIAGSYDVQVGVKRLNSRGIWQLAIGRADNFSGTESNVGPTVDDYAPTSQFVTVDLGHWAPGTTSDKWCRFTITGQNSSSSGYTECFDFIRFVHQ